MLLFLLDIFIYEISVHMFGSVSNWIILLLDFALSFLYSGDMSPVRNIKHECSECYLLANRNSFNVFFY